MAYLWKREVNAMLYQPVNKNVRQQKNWKSVLFYGTLKWRRKKGKSVLQRKLIYRQKIK